MAKRPAEVLAGHGCKGLGGTGWYERCVTTDQEVGDSSSSGRAAETPALQGFRRVKFATVEDMGHVFWVVSWSARHRDRCVRAVRDEASRIETIRVHRENFSVNCVLKTWAHLNGEGIAVARCTVDWLIPSSGRLPLLRRPGRTHPGFGGRLRPGAGVARRRAAPVGGCRSRCRQVDPAGGGVPRSADGRGHDLRGPLRLGGVRHSPLRPVRPDGLPRSVLSSCACVGRDPPVRRDTASDQQGAVEPPSTTRRRRDPH
jgi:hypothetical protein